MALDAHPRGARRSLFDCGSLRSPNPKVPVERFRGQGPRFMSTTPAPSCPDVEKQDDTSSPSDALRFLQGPAGSLAPKGWRPTNLASTGECTALGKWGGCLQNVMGSQRRRPRAKRKGRKHAQRKEAP